MRQQERYRKLVDRFEQIMPVAETELHFDSPYQLLVAVILSAQCTDKRVNMVTPDFFRAFPDVYKLSEAPEEEIYEYIKSISYPNNKTRSLKGMARMLVDKFNGQVPDNIDDLLLIPGVGRKTANVILSVIFNRPAMAVDTHVFRVSERLGLTTRSKNPLQTERKLTSELPEDIIGKAHHWLILHGRYVCKARKPLCNQCPLTDLCRYYSKNNPESKT